MPGPLRCDLHAERQAAIWMSQCIFPATSVISLLSKMDRDFRIVEEVSARLAECAKIAIGFEVRSVLQINGNDPSSAILTEVGVETPWVKDYDTNEDEGPASWGKRWDVSNWALLAAYMDDQRIGSCALAHNTPGIRMLEGRSDLVALWDLRVCPDYRRQGTGSELFKAAVSWARWRNCRELRVETQNINVPACRFYQRQGCHLISIDRCAYGVFPDEIQLIWSLDL